MADTRVEHTDLLSVLLKGSLAQKKAILDTLDERQVDFIRDLIFNFLNNFPISKAEQNKLNKKKGLKNIANSKRSNKYRKRLIKQHKKHIISLLDRYRDQLMTLI